MINKKIIKLLKRYNIWQWTQVILTGGIAILIGLLVHQLTVSPNFENYTDYSPAPNIIADGNLAEIARLGSEESREVGKNMRSGLFKSKNYQSDKPMADKTIKRIKSQLKLQCIMDLDGVPVAYVKIKGEGMKQCRSGDTISGLFTVLNINKTSVEISIVGHRELLNF